MRLVSGEGLLSRLPAAVSHMFVLWATLCSNVRFMIQEVNILSALLSQLDPVQRHFQNTAKSCAQDHPSTGSTPGLRDSPNISYRRDGTGCSSLRCTRWKNKQTIPLPEDLYSKVILWAVGFARPEGSCASSGRTTSVPHTWFGQGSVHHQRRPSPHSGTASGFLKSSHIFGWMGKEEMEWRSSVWYSGRGIEMIVE